MILDAKGKPTSSGRNDGPIMQELASIGAGRDITRPFVDDVLPLQPLDELLMNRETTIKGYKRILRDPQVHSTFQQRRLAVTARDVTIEPGGSRRADKKAADWLQEQTDHFGWSRVANKMLFGTFYGYGIGEMMYARDGMHVGVDAIKVRDRERFGFASDFDIRLFTMADQMEGETMPKNKFWVFSTGSDHDDDPYGLGLAHFLYWPVFFKKNGKAKWLKNLERWAQPVAHGQYAPGTPYHEQRKLLSALHALQHDSAFISPEGMNVNLLEAARAGTADYNELQVDENAAISKVVLSQTMTTDAEATGIGSGLGDVHQEVAENVQQSDANLLTGSFCSKGAFGEGPLCWLMRWNFPDAAMPRLFYDFSEEEDKNEMAERDAKLFQAGWQRTPESQEEAYGEGWVRVESPTPPNQDNPIPAVDVDFAEVDPTPAGTPDALLQRVLPSASVDEMMKPVEELLARATTLEEFREGLFAQFAEMDATTFGKVLQRALLTAELGGRFEVIQAPD